ncbi:hypothetical protein BDV38DRAFT_232940 [Aspergillus pseudotamarii]|uniref:Uncharacterized protein n=1 Tax=Aspergillus pseudotamarii TaxID=132259 RepID=A0A5N6TA02_ASPPS|nr:uncharacterized protein BDV38DRAFT_232940 [Aspergillus pseudotamarii]KAE8143204.1 hypothetical protein BDV38DRAFT_232940 [Aspergillus pseudotamarii]
MARCLRILRIVCITLSCLYFCLLCIGFWFSTGYKEKPWIFFLIPLLICRCFASPIFPFCLYQTK